MFFTLQLFNLRYNRMTLAKFPVSGISNFTIVLGFFKCWFALFLFSVLWIYCNSVSSSIVKKIEKWVQIDLLEWIQIHLTKYI